MAGICNDTYYLAPDIVVVSLVSHWSLLAGSIEDWREDPEELH